MKTKRKTKSKLVLVTGQSGAGMTSVLKALEDIGFEVFDNFPLTLVEPLLRQTRKANARIAIGLDSRTRGFSAKAVLETTKRRDAKLVFITCDEETLQQRFTDTRRRHPLAKDRPVREGIRQENKILADIKAKADITIDTSELSVHDMRHIVEGHFAQNDPNRLTVTLMSFGFRHGLPREADLVMDVRFMNNPHWVKSLRKKTGKNKDVGKYIKNDPDYKYFMHNFTNLLQILLPRYRKEGKNYLTIAIGCTGGKHRSVFIVEELKKWLKKQGFDAFIEHRDIPV